MLFKRSRGALPRLTGRRAFVVVAAATVAIGGLAIGSASAAELCQKGGFHGGGHGHLHHNPGHRGDGGSGGRGGVFPTSTTIKPKPTTTTVKPTTTTVAPSTTTVKPSTTTTNPTTTTVPTTPAGNSSACGAYPQTPTTACVGVPAGITLKVVNPPNEELDITQAGTVISGEDIRGDVVITADNVTIKDSLIEGIVKAMADQQKGLIVEDSEIEPPSNGAIKGAYVEGNVPPIEDGNYTLLRSWVRGWQDGPRSGGTGTVLIQDSLLSDLMIAPGEHVDGYQQYGPGNVAKVTLDHNTISGCAGNATDAGNSAIFWSDHPGAGSTLDAYNNLFECGQYSVRINDSGPGTGVVVNIHDNTILKGSYADGPTECDNAGAFNGTDGVKWSNNVLSDGTQVATACS